MSQRDVPFTLAGSDRLVGKRLGISVGVYRSDSSKRVCGGNTMEDARPL